MKNWKTTRQAILDAPLPNYGGKYAVIPHKVLIEEIHDELTNKGYIIEEERYLTTGDCKLMSGVFRIKNDDTELAPSISFTNSYNKQKRAEVRVGALVLVCKNGMIGTVGQYSRKHIGNALEDFRVHMKSAVGNLESEFTRLKTNKKEMKNTIVDKTVIANLIGDMLINEELITSVQLGIIRQQLGKSHNFKGNTLWDFYNNCTESFKNSHPSYYSTQHIKFHTYVCDKFQLTGHKGLFSPIHKPQIV
jgi:hypothetical protein